MLQISSPLQAAEFDQQSDNAALLSCHQATHTRTLSYHWTDSTWLLNTLHSETLVVGKT